jgi:hypothetical protein
MRCASRLDTIMNDNGNRSNVRCAVKRAILFVLFCGCHPAHTVMYDRLPSYPPVLTTVIYLDTSQIPFKYFKIGEIMARRGESITTEDEYEERIESLLRDMTDEAPSRGADGIISIELFDHPILGFDTSAGVTTVKKKPEVKGVLIRFERDENGNLIVRDE